MISTAIFAKLSGVTAVTDLVGTKLYPQQAPADAEYPLVTFAQVTDGSKETRPLTGQVKLFRTLQQFDIYSRDRANVDAIANAIRGAIDAVTNETWGGMAIKAAIFDFQLDGNFEPDPNLFRIIQQYRISYLEA